MSDYSQIELAMIGPDQNKQFSKDQRDRNGQINQQKQNSFQQNTLESNQASQYDSQIDMQKQQQLQQMRDQLQFKYKNILDNYYSQKIKLNEQVQKEFNELSQILEMPMESLISAIRNIQSQQNTTSEKQKVPYFLRDIVEQDTEQPTKNTTVQAFQQGDSQKNNQQNNRFDKQEISNYVSSNQQQIVNQGNEVKDNSFSNEEHRLQQIQQQQQQQSQQQTFQYNSFGNSQKNLQNLQNSGSFSQKQMSYNNRFLSDNPELTIGGDQVQQLADLSNNNREEFFQNNNCDILKESQEFFSKASQYKSNFFLYGFEEIDQIIQQNKEQKLLDDIQSQQEMSQKEINNKQSNEQKNQIQNVQMAPSSLQIIKQLQISPFSQMRQSYDQQQSYSQQNQKRKEQLNKRQNSNLSRDEQTIMELNKIQQTQQQREGSEETREKNKQLRILQLLSKSSPERQQQYIQEKQRYLQNEDFHERGVRQSSKDSDNSDRFGTSKKIINIQPTNLLSREQTAESFQESPINYKSPQGLILFNEEFSKSLSSQRSPLNQSKNGFQFPLSTKSASEKAQQQQQFFSQQKKTLQLIESHQELDDLRKKIEDLNIEICNKDLEIIDLSAKLRDYKNQQLNLALKSQKEQKEFEQFKLQLVETKNYLNQQIREYLQVLQEIQACENSTYSIKSKAAKQVRNSQQLTEKNLQAVLKSSVKSSKGEALDKSSGSKEDANIKVESSNKAKIGGLPSSSTFSDSKANHNKSILEDEEEDELSEQQSIDLNKNSLEQDEIISNQILEENESYFIQYIQTQKLLNSHLISLQINESHKIKVQQFQTDYQSLKQENQRLQEQINQMSGILNGINGMEQQQKDIDQYLDKLDQEKKSLELILDEFNRRVSKKKSEINKAKEQMNHQLNQIKQKKEETALEHNQIISKNQIKIQELQKKKSQINQKLDAELNQLRKELRSKVSLNNFEKANLENDIKKKQEVLNLFAQKQQVSIKPQTEKLQQELQKLQQTNKLLKKDIEDKKIQLEQLQIKEENDELEDFDEYDDENEDSSENQNQFIKAKLNQKQLKQELKQQKEKLEQEKSFSNAQNEEFVVQTEQKLKYHNGLKAQIVKLQQELELLQTKRDECFEVQQNIEQTINNSKSDLNEHEQLSQEIKQVQESNLIIKNKINQFNTVLLSKKSLAAKQEDEINNQLRPMLEECIIQMSNLNMEEQDLIQQRKQLKNQLQQ